MFNVVDELLRNVTLEFWNGAGPELKKTLTSTQNDHNLINEEEEEEVYLWTFCWPHAQIFTSALYIISASAHTTQTYLRITNLGGGILESAENSLTWLVSLETLNEMHH